MFARLKLKEIPFFKADPVGQDEIYLMKWHLREMFPDLDLDIEIRSIANLYQHLGV